MLNIEYTEQGKKLIAELVAGGKKIQFTKAKTNKQETPISKVEIIDGNTISIDIVFENMNLKEPYYIDSVDLYVNEETDGEFIFVRITPDEPDFMPAFYDNNANSINYKVKLMINNTENVEIVVNPSGFVTIKELEEILSKIEFQPSGGVKFDYDIPYFTDKTNYLILRANEDDFDEFKTIFRELKRLIITDDNLLYFFDGSDFRLLGGRTDLTEVLNQINNLNDRISDLENNDNEDLNGKLEILENSVNDNFEDVFSKLKDIESIPYIEEITDDIPYSLILRIDKDNKDGLGNVLQGTQRIVIEEDTKKINLFNGEEYVLLSGGSAAQNGIPFLESTKSYTDDSIENTSTPLIFRTDNPQVITETLESEHLIIDENTNHLYLYDKENLREISGGTNSDTPSFSAEGNAIYELENVSPNEIYKLNLCGIENPIIQVHNKRENKLFNKADDFIVSGVYKGSVSFANDEQGTITFSLPGGSSNQSGAVAQCKEYLNKNNSFKISFDYKFTKGSKYMNSCSHEFFNFISKDIMPVSRHSKYNYITVTPERKLASFMLGNHNTDASVCTGINFINKGVNDYTCLAPYAKSIKKNIAYNTEHHFEFIYNSSTKNLMLRVDNEDAIDVDNPFELFSDQIVFEINIGCYETVSPYIKNLIIDTEFNYKVNNSCDINYLNGVAEIVADKHYDKLKVIVNGGSNSAGSSSEIKPDLQYIVPVMKSNEQEGYKANYLLSDISAYNNSSIISYDLEYTKQKLIELKLKNKLIINNGKMYYFDGENINQV